MEMNLESISRDLERTCRRILVLETLLSNPVNCCANHDNHKRWSEELEIMRRFKGMLEAEQALLANGVRR